jgi:hypothetical protein
MTGERGQAEVSTLGASVGPAWANHSLIPGAPAGDGSATVTTAKTVVTVARGTSSPALRSMPGLFDPV